MMADSGQDASDGMMSETFYPMNHVPWSCGSNPPSPAICQDKETQCNGSFFTRGSSVVDLQQAVISTHPSGDSGFGEHATLAARTSSTSSSGALRESSGVTEDASQGPSNQASSGAIYSEVASTPSSNPGNDREQFSSEDEIVHLSEEPLTSMGEEGDSGRHDVVSSQEDVRRLDAVDGPASLSQPGAEDSCPVDCLYYTLKCCDCRII